MKRERRRLLPAEEEEKRMIWLRVSTFLFLISYLIVIEVSEMSDEGFLNDGLNLTVTVAIGWLLGAGRRSYNTHGMLEEWTTLSLPPLSRFPSFYTPNIISFFNMKISTYNFF